MGRKACPQACLRPARPPKAYPRRTGLSQKNGAGQPGHPGFWRWLKGEGKSLFFFKCVSKCLGIVLQRGPSCNPQLLGHPGPPVKPMKTMHIFHKHMKICRESSNSVANMENGEW